MRGIQKTLWEYQKRQLELADTYHSNGVQILEELHRRKADAYTQVIRLLINGEK